MRIAGKGRTFNCEACGRSMTTVTCRKCHNRYRVDADATTYASHCGAVIRVSDQRLVEDRLKSHVRQPRMTKAATSLQRSPASTTLSRRSALVVAFVVLAFLVVVILLTIRAVDRPGDPWIYDQIESMNECGELADLQQDYFAAARANEGAEADTFLEYASAVAERGEDLGCT